jgi:integrase
MYIRVKNNRIYLIHRFKDDSNNWKSKEFSLNKKATKENLKWAEFNKERLLNEKLNSISNITYKPVLFEDYGLYVLNVTDQNRNSFSNKDVYRKFNKIVDMVGNIDIRVIKASTILSWQNTMLKSYSSKSVKNYRSVFNMILDYAYKDDLISKNPFSLVKSPKKESKELPIVYNIDDINLLLSNCKNQRFRNILQFAFFSGVRPGELIALKWSDIDLKNNTILIQRRIRDGDISTPKGEKIRHIYLLPQAKEALLNQLEYTQKDWVFLNRFNNYYTSSDCLDLSFKILCRKCDLDISRFYNTRHSFATLMLQFHQSEAWLTQQLGHYDFRTTKEHYLSKLSPNIGAINTIKIV